MKTSVLIMAVLSVTLRLGAQQYQPFPDTNAIWKEYSPFFVTPPTLMWTDEYVDGDTLINLLSYTKVYNDGRSQQNSNVTTWSRQYMGALRNDTAGKLVLFVPRDSMGEKILYDFNLSLGQIFPLMWFNQQNYVPDTIVLVDSVLVGNTWRKHYRSANGWYDVVEGMGSLGGLFNPNWNLVGPNHFELTCFYQNNHPAWPDTSQGCASPVGITTIEHAPGTTLFPVPSEGKVFIENINPGFDQLNVFLPDGQLFLSAPLSSDAFQLDLSGAGVGVYFIQIVNSGTGETMKEKILIAR